MTKEERDAEILRLLPYAITYARAYLKSRKTRSRDVEDVYSEAQLTLVRLVDSGRPAQYLKRAVEWGLCNYARRQRERCRESVFADFDDAAGLDDDNCRELSFMPSTADDDAKRVLFSKIHSAVMRETHGCAFRLRAALRAHILQGLPGAWRNCGYSSETFYSCRRRIFEKIKNNKEIAARFVDSYK